MKILLNGKEEEFPKPLTIAELLCAKNWQPERIVVELNKEIVGKEWFAKSILKQGDSVEILKFVGGGQGCER